MDLESTKRDSLLVSLARAIAAGDFPAGSPLIERSIAEDFGSSRTPVREALRALEYQGLVFRVPGKGTFVAPMSSQDIEEVFFLRELLETTAARLSVARIPEQPVLLVKKVMEGFRSPFTPEVARQFREADYSLHDLFLRHCGNRRLNELLRQLRPQIDRVRYTLTEFETSREEHLVIIKHLLERDVVAVVDSLAVHLRKIKERALDFCLSDTGATRTTRRHRMVHVRTKIERIAPSLVEAFRSIGSATAHEAMGRRGALDPKIKPAAPSMRVCGPAFTVRCHPGDNLMLLQALDVV